MWVDLRHTTVRDASRRMKYLSADSFAKPLDAI
jgi:hypothetical protein